MLQTSEPCPWQNSTTCAVGPKVDCTNPNRQNSPGWVKCDSIPNGIASTFCTNATCNQFTLLVKQGAGNQIIGNNITDDTCSGTDNNPQEVCGMGYDYIGGSWGTLSTCAFTSSGTLLSTCFVVSRSSLNCISITNNCGVTLSHIDFKCTNCHCDCTEDHGHWLKSCIGNNGGYSTSAAWTWNQGYGDCATVPGGNYQPVTANPPQFVDGNTPEMGCPVRVTFPTVTLTAPCGGPLPNITDDCYELLSSCP